MKLTSIQPVPFRQQDDDAKRKRNIILGISAGAIASPLLTFIDGDSFKKSYKNRNVIKYTTGLCMAGGLAASGVLLTDKQVKQSSNPQRSKILRNAVAGAVILPLLLFVENWAQINKKPFAKKWYFLALAGGALLGALTAKINQK